MSIQVESSVGIKSYISNHKGFPAIIKQRYSDFLVNEIGQDGETIRLTSLEVVPVPTSIKNTIDTETQPSEIKDEEIELLKLLSGQMSLEQVKPSTFIIKTTGNDYIRKDFDMKNFKNVKINVDNVSKERRTVLHMYLKSKFPNLNCVTNDCDSSKYIVVTKKDGDSTYKRRVSWPASQRFLTFVLYKENIDTIDAVNIIQGKLKLKQNMLTYSGVKDKRAKTSQLVSVRQVAPQNIASAMSNFARIHVGNFTFRSKPLKLGNLLGNHFQIVLRDAKVEDSDLEAAVKSLRENGFINYFGMQRFGSVNLTTHLIGKAILKGNFKEAIDMILRPHPADSESMLKAKRIWESKRDASEAFKTLASSRNSIEKQVFGALAKHGTSNFVTSIEKLPRNVSLMYVHAYQSYIWNSVVSKRIEKHGLKVLPGDLIYKEAKYKTMLGNSGESKDEMKIGICDHDTFLEDCCDCENMEDNDKSPVHVLSEDEAKQFDITEIAMPVPGLRSKYPENETKDWYSEFLDKDGITFDKMKHKVKTFNVGGTYRKVVIRIPNLNHFSCYYDDPTLPLLQSDLDVINNVDVSCNRLEQGKHKAVIVNFTLPTSSYATMALRELMKIETSSQFQETLNQTTSSTSKDSDVDMNGKKINEETSVNEIESNKRTCDFEENMNGKKMKT
ncbi:UNVERIFIED_CONTAM: hypothetical protein RMT77_007069 [Armadillidium vulgare]